MSTAQKHSVLAVKDLAIGYGKTIVADAINFEAHAGELIGIIGVNGVGKSTLLRTLSNLQKPMSGNIFVEENTFSSYDSSALAAKISIVLTEPIASKNLTVQELIALGRHPYTNWLGRLTNEDKVKISEAIELLQLQEFKNKKCYELSDGQLQRVMIARAIAQDTSLILLDEPTTHLDLYHKVEILKLLQSITQKTNKTILFTSHEIEMALQLCHKVLLLKTRSSLFNTPEQLIEQGAFNDLFPKDTVRFDTASKTFRIQK